MDVSILARALHVLGVVVWIGGVAMVTSVALPALRAGELGPNWLGAFEAIERRFVWLARSAVLLVGLTGLYLTDHLDLWDRFRSVQFWWMHAMIGLWVVFALVLFLLEPLVLHQKLRKWAQVAPDRAFAFLHRAHWIVLVLGLVTMFGAVAGSHGAWSL